jgi:DNA-binding IclR family transcriptional regulator
MSRRTRQASGGATTAERVRLTPLERYIAALEAVAIAREPMALGELARACDVPLPTAHRLATNLVEVGLLANGGRRGYGLGQRLLRLVHAGTDLGAIRIAVDPMLDALAARLGDTCFLARLNGSFVTAIAIAVPDRGTLAGFVFPESRMPVHASAAAKAIMAFQEPALIARAIAEGLPALTPRTVADRLTLLREFETVRARGYATCWGEIAEGLGAIACPVQVRDLGVVYSLGVSGSEARLRERSIEQTVAELRSVADEMARVLRDGPGVRHELQTTIRRTEART